MARADLAQPLQVTQRWQQHAGRAGNGLHDHGGDVAGIVQRHEALEVIGELGAVRRQAAGEGIRGQQVGVRQVVHARQHGAEELAVVDHAAHGNAAEADPVVAALAADQAGAGAFAAHAVVSQRNLERGVHRLRARIGEEHVVEARRGQPDDGVGQLKGRRVSHLEGWRVFHGRDLLRDRGGDFGPAMAGVHAPQAGNAVQDAPTVGGPVVHALGAGQQAGRRLELAIGREGHPEGLELVGGKPGVVGGGIHGAGSPAG